MMSKCSKPMPKWNHKPQVSGSTEKTSLQHYAISIVYKSIKRKHSIIVKTAAASQRELTEQSKEH